MVRSPSLSTRTTIVPVRPRRCTRTSTPRPVSSAVSVSATGSAPTHPMKRAGTRALANAATFAALPPRARRMTDGLSVANLAGPAGHTTTSSTRSPTVTSTPESLVTPAHCKVALRDAVEFAARAYVDLGEHLAEVVLDGSRAEEQPRADLRVRQPVPR